MSLAPPRNREALPAYIRRCGGGPSRVVHALPAWFTAGMLHQCYGAQPAVLQRGKLNVSFWARMLRFLQQTNLQHDRDKIVPRFELFAGGEWQQHKHRVQYRVRQQLDEQAAQLQEAERFLTPLITAPPVDARDIKAARALAQLTQRISDTCDRVHDLSKKMEIAPTGATYKSLVARFRAQQARLDKAREQLRRADTYESTLVAQVGRILGEVQRRYGKAPVNRFLRNWQSTTSAVEQHEHWNLLRQELLDQLHRPLQGGGSRTYRVRASSTARTNSGS